MWTLMTRRKIKSAGFVVPSLSSSSSNREQINRGDLGEIRDEIPPCGVKVKCCCCLACARARPCLCVLSTCDCFVSAPQAPADSLNLILCDPESLCSELFSQCLCCDVVPVTAAGHTGRNTLKKTLKHALVHYTRSYVC